MLDLQEPLKKETFRTSRFVLVERLSSSRGIECVYMHIRVLLACPLLGGLSSFGAEVSLYFIKIIELVCPFVPSLPDYKIGYATKQWHSPYYTASDSC